ncbi:hypothetical protein GCM10027399_06020 [Curvibacter fontanus]
MRGEHANPAMVTITQTLAVRLRRVQTAAATGASHCLINTHPQDCATLLGTHLTRAATLLAP